MQEHCHFNKATKHMLMGQTQTIKNMSTLRKQNYFPVCFPFNGIAWLKVDGKDQQRPLTIYAVSVSMAMQVNFISFNPITI